MKTRTIAVLGGLGVAAIALIGAGASATFTQNTTSSQTITAGTMNVTVSSLSPGTGGNGTQSITLPPSNAYESSSFVESYTVLITNNSNIPVNEIAYTLTDPNALSNGASLAFNNEAWACLYSDQYIYFNEPLSTVIGYGETAEIDTLAGGATDSYTLVVYAGPTENTGCGGAVTRYLASPWTAPDGTVVPAQYYNSSNGNAYYTPDYAGPAPLLGANSAAASLNSDAEGGVIIPTFTVTYEG